MVHWLFSVLLIFDAFCMAMENPIASTSYRFEVYTVGKCPMNKSEFETAAIRMNCSLDTRYLCAPDRNLSSLIEFCTDVRISLFGPDNCVRLDGTGNLNHYNCGKFSSGCPSTPYFDDEIYRYPACLSISRDLNCFVAETKCMDRLYNTSTLEMVLNSSKREDSTSKMETNTTETSLNMNNLKIIIPVLCVFVIIVTIVIGIIGLAFHKRLSKKSGETKTEVDEERLKNFLTSGKLLTARHARCIIVGCDDAGKTTLLKRLQNAKFKDLKNIKKTELIDVHVNIFKVYEDENTIQDVHNYKKLPSITFPPIFFKEIGTTKQFDETPFTAKRLIKGNEFGNIKFNPLIYDSESMDESEDTNVIIERFLTEVEKFESGERNSFFVRNKITKFYPTPELHETDGYTSTHPVFPVNAKMIFSNMIDAVKELSCDDYLCPRITFLDFAGQSMYYAFQNIYFSPETCYIFVVDMTKTPDEKVNETDEKCCSLFESWTYEDYYRFWFNSIACYSDPDSQVLIVGTHADNMSEQGIEKFFNEFSALFDHHHDIAAKKIPIRFPKKGSKLADLKEIKTCIANIVSEQGYSTEIQPLWAMFEHVMQENKSLKIIPRKTLSDYNGKLSRTYRLKDNSITEMLLFMHRVGNIIFFDECKLNETIILDVQWFVDAFKSIIEYHKEKTITDKNSSRFKTTGEITDKELTRIWEDNKEGQAYILHKKEILLYMEHLGLVAVCDAKKEKLPIYYIPSMKKMKLRNQSKHFTKSSVLCLQFDKNGELTHNIFNYLVVNCLKKPEWSLLQENEQNCWYENVACFFYRNCNVVVCLCKFQIQLQVWNPKQNSHIQPELLGDIQQSVEKILHGRKYLYKIGYKCKNGMLNAEEDNSIIAQTEFPISRFNCPNCASDNKHHVDNQMCWVLPGRSKYSDEQELFTELYNLLDKEGLRLIDNVMSASTVKTSRFSIYGKLVSPNSDPDNGTDISTTNDMNRLRKISTIVRDITDPYTVSVERYIRLLDITIKSLTTLDADDQFKDELEAFSKDFTCLKTKYTKCM